jgi:hypothetical protein
MKRFIALAAMVVSFGARDIVGSDSLTFESAETPATLLELFTSEGCSSCPRADAWISQLKSSPDLWTKVVPVAFHVDYWNHLGWRDRFARAEFTARQRRYASAWHNDSLYTPAVVVNGREWHGWFENQALPALSITKAGKLRVTFANGTDADAIFIPESARRVPIQLNIALLGANLESAVNRGENSGRNLHHDFVVLQFARINMAASGDSCTGSVSLHKQSVADKPSALAAWVTTNEIDPPIQATGGWLRR